MLIAVAKLVNIFNCLEYDWMVKINKMLPNQRSLQLALMIPELAIFKFLDFYNAGIVLSVANVAICDFFS